MKLKEMKEQLKGVDGDLLVMRPDGKGGYVEVTSVRVEEIEMLDMDDQEVVIIDG